ncbi:carbohydrate esterase family 9 [Cordyceps militaris]|uniref:Carbohydrate esterase family 9 n=1 Tax=Cordyceps militaris TaxID=73501 RepID=A0A2H4SCL3_CORMI|nr:carbohydrate esterase family 9 [Cordyceps militaris]
MSASAQCAEPAVYPVFLQDAVKANRVLIALTLRFNDVLDVQVVRDSLSQLLRIGHWRKLTGRLHQNADGGWHVRIPSQYTPQDPDFAFFEKTYAAELASHPIGKLYPAATRKAATQPLDPAIRALLVPDGFPGSFDALVARQWPQLTLFASSFRDATVLTLLLPHTAMDASAITALLRNWSRVMAGDAAGSVERVHGAPVDPLSVLDRGAETPPLPPHVLDRQRMTWWQIIAFVALFLWRKVTWGAAETRLVYLPEEALRALKARTMREAQTCAPGSDTFLSEGDILTAWLSRLTLAGTGRQIPATILDVINARNQIPAVKNEEEIFLQNLLGVAFTPLSAKDMQSSTGAIALRHRRSLTQQLSEPAFTLHLQRMRHAIRKSPFRLPPVFYGHASALVLVSNNVSRPGYAAVVDFGPAVLHRARTERRNAPGTPVFAMTIPTDMSDMMGFMSIWGKDNQGGFWLSATMSRAGWGLVEEHVADIENYTIPSNTFSPMPGLPLPPPYEVAAYPSAPPSRRVRIRGWLSRRTLASLALALFIFFLCLSHHPARRGLTEAADEQFASALEQCHARSQRPPKTAPGSRTQNPRWAADYGQKQRIVLRNATLFDGQRFVDHAVDIVFSRGLVESVQASGGESHDGSALVYNLHGRYVTPGLVDMHSHHMLSPWPGTDMTADGAEVRPDTRAVTGQMRVIDALKAYDEATAIIASGGVTTSLVIPGSSNLIGGEGAPVKNALRSGAAAEPVVEDVLLERGLPPRTRRRYMKMALGENPKAVWGYSRLGNAWRLREHFQKARDVMQAQDDYCARLQVAEQGSARTRSDFLADNARFPFNLELESVVALLRGQVSLHNHNYEPQDLETMVRISEEFGFVIAGFHHAVEAWQVPAMLSERVPNVTIATFAEFSLYKHEAYWPSLYAGHVLDKGGIKVAYKSDHVESFTNAKYLLCQAAVAHGFHLPAEKALQAVTAVPAAAMDQDHRVGYCRPGYDADIVVWDDHPLNRGATPLQVFIDGIPQLNDTMVEKSTGSSWYSPLAEGPSSQVMPQVKYEPDDKTRRDKCQGMKNAGGNMIISGIRRTFALDYPELAIEQVAAGTDSLQLILENGRLVCAGTPATCQESRARIEATTGSAHLRLTNGHVAPGLSALTNALGVREIATDPSTGDGGAGGQSLADPASILYAKHGAALDGKAFARARLGGVTRAVTAPVADGAPPFVSGVSVEIRTGGTQSLLHGGIVQEEVALHVALGEAARADEGAVSRGVQKIRTMLEDGRGRHNETVFGRVATGRLPLLVYADNKYEIEQLIWIKKDFADTNLVLVGAMEAPFVAKDLAAAGIPAILTRDRGAPTTFGTRDGFVGPPLTRSIASYLKDAGVKFGLALLEPGMPSDYKIHDLLPEAGWTAKYAGLRDDEAVALVTRNVEDILDLKHKNRDIVVYEGNPLYYGATVALVLTESEETGRLDVVGCFPRENEMVVTTGSLA